MNQIPEGRGIEAEFFPCHRGNQLRARLVIRFVEHMLARLLAELLGISRGQKSALMMIEPPGHFRRIGILEVHNHVFIAVEDPAFPRLRRPVRHARELKFSAFVKFLTVKTVKESSGSRAIETTIVKAKPNLSHLGVYLYRPFTVPNGRRHKANQDVRLRQNCQEETLNAKLSVFLIETSSISFAASRPGSRTAAGLSHVAARTF